MNIESEKAINRIISECFLGRKKVLLSECNIIVKNNNITHSYKTLKEFILEFPDFFEIECCLENSQIKEYILLKKEM